MECVSISHCECKRKLGQPFHLVRDSFWTYEKIWTYKAHHFYRQRYLTAATYISSRAFPSSLLSPTPSLAYSPTSQPVLLPGIDAFNHARGQPISWIVTYPDTNDTSQEPKISLVLHTATPKGGELFNNYGPKPNSELILGYGFSIPRNPDDTIILKIGSKSGDGKKWEIGREAQGVENMWSDLIKVFIQDPSQNPTYEDMLDASSALQEMIQNLIDRLPAEMTVEMSGIRVEVITMFQDYLEGIYRFTFLYETNYLYGRNFRSKRHSSIPAGICKSTRTSGPWYRSRRGLRDSIRRRGLTRFFFFFFA